MSLRDRTGIWHWRFMVDGISYSGSTGLPATKRNESAALREEAEAHKNALEGRPSESKIKAVPFNDGAEMFLAWCDQEHREKPNTARRTRTSFASLRQFFGVRPVRAITAGQIEDYKAWRRSRGIRDVTLHNDLSNLSKFFKYAKKHTWVRSNPLADVDIPSGEAVRMHILTADEERIYFDACRGRSLNLHDMGRIVLSMGLRPNDEALALRWTDIDFQANWLKVTSSKTVAGKRTLPLTPVVRAILLIRQVGAESEWVFPSPRRSKRHIMKLNNAHAEVLEETGLLFVPYDLRHTFATRLAMAGCPLPTLAKILGHASLRVVAKYVHPQQADVDRAMAMYAGARTIDEDVVQKRAM